MKRFLLLNVLFFFTTNWGFSDNDAPSFRIKNVHHILFTVKDLKASLHFYQDILGLTLAQRYKTFAMLNAGTLSVYLSTLPCSVEKQAEEKDAGIFGSFDALLSEKL